MSEEDDTILKIHLEIWHEVMACHDNDCQALRRTLWLRSTPYKTHDVKGRQVDDSKEATVS